jgi:hypothetical protein
MDNSSVLRVPHYKERSHHHYRCQDEKPLKQPSRRIGYGMQVPRRDVHAVSTFRTEQKFPFDSTPLDPDGYSIKLNCGSVARAHISHQLFERSIRYMFVRARRSPPTEPLQKSGCAKIYWHGFPYYEASLRVLRKPASGKPNAGQTTGLASTSVVKASWLLIRQYGGYPPMTFRSCGRRRLRSRSSDLR